MGSRLQRWIFSYNVQTVKDINVSADVLRDELTKEFESAPVVKLVDTENTFNITTSYLVSETGQDTPNKVLAKLYEGISKVTGIKHPLLTFQIRILMAM